MEMQYRPEDTEAAKQLVADHPLLKDDPITIIALNEGIGAGGLPIKSIPGFVMARGCYLELRKMEEDLGNLRLKLRQLRDGDPSIINSMVESSSKPELENWLN